MTGDLDSIGNKCICAGEMLSQVAICHSTQHLPRLPVITLTMYKIPNIREHFYIFLSDDPHQCTVKLDADIARIRSYLDNP